MSGCRGPECDRPARAAGLCASHYQQRRRGQELRPLGKQVEADVSFTLRLPADLATAASEAAAREGLHVAEWWRRAGRDRVLRQAASPRRHPRPGDGTEQQAETAGDEQRRGRAG